MTHSKIGIKNLEIECIIGLFPHERIHKQLLHVDIEMVVDYQSAAMAWDINKSIDYAEVSARFTEWVQQSEFLLIENIALEGCQKLLKKYSLLEECTIKVKKPAAIENADYAWVSHSESRQK